MLPIAWGANSRTSAAPGSVAAGLRVSILSRSASEVQPCREERRSPMELLLIIVILILLFGGGFTLYRR